MTPPRSTSARPSRAPRRPFRALAAGLAAVGLLLAGCTLPGASQPSASDGAGDAAATPAPAGLESYYAQKVTWEDCNGGFVCATVQAPLDYEKPDGERIKLALIRERDAVQGRQSLVINPGGPGGSGVSYLRNGGAYSFGEDVRNEYAVVGFDPRGVGESTAVKCLSGKENDQRRAAASIPADEAQVGELLQDSSAYAKACEANSPAGLLGQLGTKNAARDLDIIRNALGDAKLNYLGYSYGTKLGATFAELFPATVGRLVLDGAMDPSLDADAVGGAQAEAFERALDLFLQDCVDGGGCPFAGTASEARAAMTQWVHGLEASPLDLQDGRVFTAFDAVQAILLALYEPRNAPRVTQGLTSAIQDGDATDLMALADLSSDRAEDGSYSNTNDAFTAINCQDYSHGDGNAASILARGKEFEKKAPFFGRYMGYDDACSQWPAAQTEAPAAIKGSADLAPIVIVGTTGDPATPYAWSEALSKQLPNSRVLTWEGEGHTAYGRSNQCVASAVDAFLVKGTLPESGARC
ncbi:alpha/beta hydrolase [Galactobacter valiniphilus]|uniref:alpha/beta hydrolase n=1 Tax=Galactobacter valiniphilus TaxID=2676122 RepID=UPI003735FF31